jgi:hypothetical protein
MLHVEDRDVESNVLIALTQLIESNMVYYTDQIVKHE